MYISSVGRAIALISFLAITASELAIADSGREVVPDRVSAVVVLSDLDLRTPAGAQAARDRIRKEASRLCRKFSDSRRASDRETVADCMRQAVQEAVATSAPETTRAM